MWKMQYKPIRNYHMENVILRKDFILGMIGFFFMFSSNSFSFSFSFFRKPVIGSLWVWRTRFGTRLECLNQKNFKEPLVTIVKKLHKSSLKTILTLKAQFKNIFWWHILGFFKYIPLHNSIKNFLKICNVFLKDVSKRFQEYFINKIVV
jgi:hypothetical protein